MNKFSSITPLPTELTDSMDLARMNPLPPRIRKGQVLQMYRALPSDFLEETLTEFRKDHPSSRAGRLNDDKRRKFSEMVDRYCHLTYRHLQGQDVSNEVHMLNKRICQFQPDSLLSGKMLARTLLSKWMFAIYTQLRPE